MERLRLRHVGIALVLAVWVVVVLSVWLGDPNSASREGDRYGSPPPAQGVEMDGAAISAAVGELRSIDA